MLSPNDKKKILFSQVIVLILIFSGLLISTTLWTFSLNNHLITLYLDLIISLVFCLEIFFIKKMTGKNKFKDLKQTSFDKAKDIIALLPLSSLGFFFGIPAYDLLQIVRIIKITKLRKVLKLTDSLVSLTNYFRMISIILSTFFAFHLIACFWLEFTMDETLSPTSNYLRSMYWVITTLTTVGYGDITPSTDVTRIFTMLIMLLGVAFYGVIIGIVSRLISIRDQHKREASERIQRMLMLMQHYKIPWKLQEEVHSYYKQSIGEKFALNDKELLIDLPDSLQKEIKNHMKIKIIKDLKIFQQASEASLKTISHYLKTIFYSPGDKIIKKGETGEELFIIAHGTVRVLDKKQKTLAFINEGSCFGEMALLQDTVRTATVEAVTFCDLYKLSKDEFQKVINLHPEIMETFEQIVKTYKKES